MAITLSNNFITELRRSPNTPNVIIEIEFDSGTRKFGYHAGGFTDVLPVLKSVSSLQNKIDTKDGFTTLGQISIVITGRENFKDIIKDEYLKNRRVTRKDGFVASGFDYSDYADTFTGTIQKWSRKGDELTLVVSDDLIEAKKKIPVENSTNTQLIDYRDTNPVDIMKDILTTQLGIDAAYVNTTQFDNERDTWLNTWKYSRVLTKPEDAIKYLNELQQETLSFLIHDGEKISYKYFGPATPTQGVPSLDDNNNLLSESITQKSGYDDNFYNRVVLYYNYDESGNDDPENFESVYIASDASSQDSSEWDETKTKVVKSKWIRTMTFNQPTNITGVTIYHISANHDLGTAELTYNSTSKELQWESPSGFNGKEVVLDRDGLFTLENLDKSRTIRVVVDTASLPISGSPSDEIAITSLDGGSHAAALANKLLRRYRDPVSTVGFGLDINDVSNNSEFIKPTDLIDVTTDEACDKGQNDRINERLMITSIRPDFTASKVKIEAVQARMSRRYGFIAPAGYPDYPSATDEQRQYAFIGDASNNVDGGTVDGYYIW